MKIAIDLSPLTKGNFLQHRVRGTGFYLENLKKSLLKFFPDNKYIFFSRGGKLPDDIDLIHYPYFEPFFLTLPFFKKKKTAVTVHDLTPLVFPKNFPPGVRGKIKWQIQKFSLRNSNIIITDSNSSKKDIIKFTGIDQEKIKVIYLAAGEKFKKIGNLKHSMKNLPEKFILYVGDSTWNKNLVRLLYAIEKTNLPFVMIGKALVIKDYDSRNAWNSDLVKVQELISKNKNITALGFVSEDDLIALYNSATIFIMPSIYEGFGLPILEAMSCGCPVLTTREGSIPEVAGEAAFYVNAYDIDDIVKGIKKVFLDKALQRELSNKGLEQAKKFSWKKTAQETTSVYKFLYER